jgi:hypothetical protein
MYNTCFTDFFAFFRQAEERDFGEFAGPFYFSAPQNMSSFWKSIKEAVRQRLYFVIAAP